jgi:transcriptional regulator of acetoin/glycerol metabolism
LLNGPIPVLADFIENVSNNNATPSDCDQGRRIGTPFSSDESEALVHQGCYERRTAAHEARQARGQSIGGPMAHDKSKAALAQRMHASGESASTIATTLGVSRATVYRVLAEQTE